jgi:predicted ATPase
MIRSMNLINFKPFVNQFIQFKPLTLLSGLNSTGKSSVLQSLLLLRQSYQQGLLPKTGLALNGELVQIGTAKDALYEGAQEDYISFDIVWRNDIEGNWRFNYDREVNVLNLASEPVAKEIYELSLFNKNFHYIQAERIGPRSSYPMSDFDVREKGIIASNGKYAAQFLIVNESKVILNSKLSHPNVKTSKKDFSDDPETKSLALIDQVQAWMGEISPGTRIKINSNPDMDLISLQYLFEMGKEVSNPYRATNVGFGISYTLPIIVAVLASEPGTLILIENPEAHLHPKGQSKMGELLGLAASCGVQVVIETHSDHVLNGIRRTVHGGRLDPKDVQLHYFQRKEKEGQAFTEVVSPRIDADGRIDKWPEGFFDQAEKDLLELL